MDDKSPELEVGSSDHEPWCNKNQEGGNSYAFECDCGYLDDTPYEPYDTHEEKRGR